MLEWLAGVGRSLAEATEPPSATARRRDPYLYAPVRTGDQGGGGDGSGDNNHDDEINNDEQPAVVGVSHPLLLRPSSSSSAAADPDAATATAARGFVPRARQLLSHLSLSEISGTLRRVRV